MCSLKKALYDFKQSTREFYLFLANMLKEFNFKIIITDQSIFHNDEIKIVITAHIDNLLIFDFKVDDIMLKKQIEKKIEIFDLDDISYYLDMEISRNKKKKKLFLSQNKYTNEILKKFNIIDQKSIYCSDVQDVRLEKNLDQVDAKAIKAYQQQVELLIYLMTITKSNLAFSVCNCARYMSYSSAKHFKTLNRV